MLDSCVFLVLNLGEMRKETKMKFRKVENPMETVTVNGVKIVPDEVFKVKLKGKK